MAFEKSFPHLCLLAASKAVRFAMEPPLVNKPPPFFIGKWKICSNQFMVIISSSEAAGDALHPPEKILKPEARVSANTLI